RTSPAGLRRQLSGGAVDRRRLLSQIETSSTGDRRPFPFCRAGSRPMDFLCPSCQKMLTVPDQYAGTLMKCPLCQNTFQAPALPAKPPPLEAAGPATPPTPPPAPPDAYGLKEPPLSPPP